MNYPRVNLLKKNEQRFQGAVSRKFIFISAVVAPILLISVLSGIKLIQYSGVQSQLLSSREIWEDLEPRLVLYKEERRGLNMNRTGLDLFNGWNETQASFVKLLTDIQANVPEQIQFTRLSVRSQPTSHPSNNERQGRSSWEHREDRRLGISHRFPGCRQACDRVHYVRCA